MPDAKAWNTHTAMAAWRDAYESSYGTPYTPGNWAKEMSQIRLLMSRYDEPTLRAIFDVVARLYARKWATARFTRPTIGALVSWLAAQAEPYALANVAGGEQTELTLGTDVDDNTLADEMTAKGWL